jgi:hypothetical protein
MRKIIAIIAAIAIVILLCVPVVRTDQSTCGKIRPGMTLEDARAIIGGEEGTYDGMNSYSGDCAKYSKGYFPTWVSIDGMIVLETDSDGRIFEAKFIPISRVGFSPFTWAFDRITRNTFH